MKSVNPLSISLKSGISLLLLIFCAHSGYSAENFSSPQAISQTKEKRSPDVFSFNVENDIYFSDRYYTNGLKAMYTSQGDDWWATFPQFALLKLFAPEREAQYFQTVSLGQMMCVSSDIKDSNPPLDDRPYCGWLYIGAAAHVATKNSLDSLSVNLGVVGPLSLAEDAQKFYHSIIGADWPQGWHDQIKNEPGIVISYRHSERFLKFEPAKNFSSDIIGSLEGNLGNVRTNGELRAIWRFGFNMPDSFDPARIDYASSNDVSFFNPKSKDWHFYFYAGGKIQFVGYDISLNGNTFAKSRHVNPKWCVGEALAGVSTRYKNLEVNLNWTLRSEEYTTQKHSPQMFWTLSAKVFF